MRQAGCDERIFFDGLSRERQRLLSDIREDTYTSDTRQREPANPVKQDDTNLKHDHEYRHVVQRTFVMPRLATKIWIFSDRQGHCA